VVVAEDPAAGREGGLVQLDGLVEAPGVVVGVGEVVGRGQGVGVVVAEDPAAGARVASYSSMASSRRPALR